MKDARIARKMAVPTAALGLLALLLVGGLGAASPVAPLAPAPSVAPSTQWAYGGQVNVSLSVTTNHTTYTVLGHFAYHVVLTQTNTSSSTFMLEADRAMGFNVTAVFCLPVCGSTAKVALSISTFGREHDVGFANFTRSATVYSNGTAVHAVGLLNASSELAANQSQRAVFKMVGYLHNLTGYQTLETHVRSTTAVAFHPALGLVPDNLTATPRWNSTSAFTASGSALYVVNFTRMSNQLSSPIYVNRSLSPALNSSGTVGLRGAMLGYVTLRNGAIVPVVGLQSFGPFAPREGIIWVPSAADLFGAGGASDAAEAAGTDSAGTSALDWDVGAHGHAGLVASSTGFAPAPDASSMLGTSPESLMGNVPGGANTALAPAASSATIQAQPESVTAAEAGSQCLLGTGSCSSPGNGGVGGGSPAANHLGSWLLIGGAIVVLAGLLAGLVVARRRRPRAPVAAAAGYAAMPTVPPGATGPASGPAAGPAPNEEDSLGHLW